jgi:hypothetical protein
MIGPFEENSIQCVDAYEAIKRIPDKSIDCIYTDIPYLYQQGGSGSSELGERTAKKRLRLMGYDDSRAALNGMTYGEMLKQAKRGEREQEGQSIENGIDYAILDEFCKKYGGKLPLFIGKTITMQSQVDALGEDEITDFLSIEPILEPLDLSSILGRTRQLIIGAETGNRKGKVIPQKEWITRIVEQADKRGIRVFMKGSIRKIMGDDFRRDRLIWG